MMQAQTRKSARIENPAFRARGFAEHDMAAIIEVVRDLSSEEKHT
jgi:hypothetical protein